MRQTYGYFIAGRYERQKMSNLENTVDGISDFQDSVIGSIAIPGSGDGRDWLWGRAKGALTYAWEHYRDEFDWVMKADEDTYLIVENLKKFLSNYSSTDPIFFGCPLSRKGKIPLWVSGGSGKGKEILFLV